MAPRVMPFFRGAKIAQNSVKTAPQEKRALPVAPCRDSFFGQNRRARALFGSIGPPWTNEFLGMRSRVFCGLSNVVYKVGETEKNSVRGLFSQTVRQIRRSMVCKPAKKQGFLRVGENKYPRCPLRDSLVVLIKTIDTTNKPCVGVGAGVGCNANDLRP